MKIHIASPWPITSASRFRAGSSDLQGCFIQGQAHRNIHCSTTADPHRMSRPHSMPPPRRRSTISIAQLLVCCLLVRMAAAAPVPLEGGCDGTHVSIPLLKCSVYHSMYPSISCARLVPDQFISCCHCNGASASGDGEGSRPQPQPPAPHALAPQPPPAPPPPAVVRVAAAAPVPLEGDCDANHVSIPGLKCSVYHNMYPSISCARLVPDQFISCCHCNYLVLPNPFDPSQAAEAERFWAEQSMLYDQVRQIEGLECDAAHNKDPYGYEGDESDSVSCIEYHREHPSIPCARLVPDHFRSCCHCNGSSFQASQAKNLVIHAQHSSKMLLRKNLQDDRTAD